MKRIHLFEFMDLDRYPDFLRRIQTNILQVVMNQTKGFDYAVPYIDDMLAKTKCGTLTDLCSGAAGPWLRIYNKLKSKVNLRLSDKFPNGKMFEKIKKDTNGEIDYIGSPIDVLDADFKENAVYTMFTAFHHFKPDEVKTILKNIQDKRAAICIFDYAPAKGLVLALSPLTFIIGILQFYFLSFLVRPFTLTRLLFTNIIPVVPLVSAWDGIVSALRKYDKDSLLAITKDIEKPGYTWKAECDFSLSKSSPMVCLLGRPED